ncbi:MAG: hypothetical protein JZU47_03665 [Prolixibacteraceae bacterium]|nr:hypothetical protein [Prolixibacteraceae bacterium]
MKKIKLTLIILLAITSIARSYDNKTTHRDFNDAIVAKFKTAVPEWNEFKNYAFGFDLVRVAGPAVTASGKINITTEAKSFNLTEWIKEGGYSADEPEAPAAYRHFYDPVSNDGKSFLTDINLAGAQFNPDVDAVFWHFMGNDVNGNNEWSWYKGRDYMTKAIAEGDEKIRAEYLAKAFRSLGEVLHNTADMGCPPHVRNDAHGGFGLGGSDPFEGGFQPEWIRSFAGNKCDAGLTSLFKSATSAMNVNKELAKFTNKYFFSDETISGIGVEEYSSRNGKKNYSSPKIDKLQYQTETFNYIQAFISGRTVQMCNDQSVLLGFLTQDFRSYPRVTLKNCESQASELVPAIIEAGSYVMRHFFPVLPVSMEVKPADKKIEGTIGHKATNEYPNTIRYNGKVSFLVDGKISGTTVLASNGTFSVTETDKKFPGAKKIVAYIELAGIMIKSDEFGLDDVPKFNMFDLSYGVPVKGVKTNLVTKEVIIQPVFVDAFAFSEPVSLVNNQYVGSWSIANINPKREGSAKIIIDGEKSATIELTETYTFTSGETHKYNIVTKAIPFFRKNTGYITFDTHEAYKYTSSYSHTVLRPGVEKYEYTSPLEKDGEGQTGEIVLTLYVK